MAGLPSRRWLVRGLLGSVVLSLVLLSGVLTLSYEEPTLRSGVTTATPDSETVITSQGWHARGMSLPSRPARLVSVHEDGSVNWTHDGPAGRTNWFYDVDPLANGNLLVVNPVRGTTVVYEFDPASRERVWTERFDNPDVHDVDRINGDELLVAGINYDTGPTSNDSVFVYNRTAEEVTWEWQFKNHYPANADNGIGTKDWTHVNDVDEFREGEFLVSVRNMDQVIAVNRSTKAVELRLGRDGDYSALFEQHNPTYLNGENGTPTVLVADSENDRIVEYARTGGPPGNGSWERTWTLSGGLNWPRDADRLPNGNTLVVDSMNHRVIEVTPAGEIVWEMHAPWATYDAERVAHGDEPNGPTIREQNATGTATLHGGSRETALPSIPRVVDGVVSATPLPGELTELAVRWKHVAPWLKPMWLPTWAFSTLVVGFLIALVWAAGEGIYQRRRIRRRLVQSAGSVQNGLQRDR
jgi:hypothetical protein